jgi:hypothetical protein
MRLDGRSIPHTLTLLPDAAEGVVLRRVKGRNWRHVRSGPVVHAPVGSRALRASRRRLGKRSAAVAGASQATVERAMCDSPYVRIRPDHLDPLND